MGRWKRSLIKELSSRTPQTYKSYYEPFARGGALLFALAPASATISDINLDLVITHAVIKNKPQELIKLPNNFLFTLFLYKS
jgi:DNA adenine methylase